VAWSCTDVIESEGFFLLDGDVLCEMLRHD
jgi:hypothetical protein